MRPPQNKALCTFWAQNTKSQKPRRAAGTRLELSSPYNIIECSAATVPLIQPLSPTGPNFSNFLLLNPKQTQRAVNETLSGCSRSYRRTPQVTLTLAYLQTSKNDLQKIDFLRSIKNRHIIEFLNSLFRYSKNTSCSR